MPVFTNPKTTTHRHPRVRENMEIFQFEELRKHLGLSTDTIKQSVKKSQYKFDMIIQKLNYVKDKTSIYFRERKQNPVSTTYHLQFPIPVRLYFYFFYQKGLCFFFLLG